MNTSSRLMIVSCNYRASQTSRKCRFPFTLNFVFYYSGGVAAGIFGTAVIHPEYSRRPSSLVISSLISQKNCMAFHETEPDAERNHKVKMHEKMSYPASN